jgi:hypothetical protein
MKWPELEFGDSVAGLLLDGVADTPYVGATFRLVSPHGVTVEVPYSPRHTDEQFANVDEWFSEQTPPNNMIMYTPEGTVSMFDIAWSGHSENWGGTNASLGKLRPHEVVLAAREGDLTDPLTITELHSYLDALSAWSGASSITTDHETDENHRVQTVNIRMTGGQVLSWRQGAATMELRAQWTHDPVRDGLGRVTTLRDSVTLVSTFKPGSASFWDHFVEQRKLATLLVFIFGKPISFRRHQVRDERFAARLGGNGEVYDSPLRELLSFRSIQERARPLLATNDLTTPLVYLSNVGADGLATWSDSYEAWARFIVPSAGVLNRRGAFVEDIVLSTGMSLEAAGGLIGEREGERPTWHRGRPTMATYVFRCLQELGLEGPASAESITGLARAVANNYNDLKRADRGEFPDQVKSYLVSQVNRLVVRALAVSLTSSSAELREVLQQSREMSKIHELFDLNGMRITDDGAWHAQPASEGARPPRGVQLGGQAEEPEQGTRPADPCQPRSRRGRSAGRPGTS